MENKLIAAAVGSVLALSGNSVLAAVYSHTVDENMDYHLSGATASAQFMRDTIIADVCVNPPAAGVVPDLRTDAAKHTTVYQQDPDDWVVVCQVQASIDAGQPIVRFIKQGGGSGDGTTPVSDPANNSIKYPDPDGAAFDPITKTTRDDGVPGSGDGCGTGNTLATSATDEELGSGARFILFNGCDIPSKTVAGGDHGTSDVEPQLFFDVNTPSTGNPFVDLGNLKVKGLATLGFGVGATQNLVWALQALQFPATSDCYPGNGKWMDLLPTTAGTTVMIDVDGDGTNETAVKVGQVGAGPLTDGVARLSPAAGTARVRDSEACMPNLTSAEVTGIITGGITNWDEIQRDGKDLLTAAADANTAAGSTVVKLPLDSSFGGTLPNLDYTKVHVCRRNGGSGTHAQHEAFFNNRPCAATVDPVTLSATFLSPASLNPGNTTGDFVGATTVLTNRGSSDLSGCLSALDRATTMAAQGRKPADELFNVQGASEGFCEDLDSGVDLNGDGVLTGDSTGNSDGVCDADEQYQTDSPRFAWAIGEQSVEKNTKLTEGWRFVKIDGLAPTLSNVWAADYLDSYEQTCQRRTTHSPIDNRLTATVMNNAFDTICAGNSGAIFSANLQFMHAWGEAGWLRVPSDSPAVIPPLTPAKLTDSTAPEPINSWTRPGSSCAAPQVTMPVQSTCEDGVCL